VEEDKKQKVEETITCKVRFLSLLGGLGISAALYWLKKMVLHKKEGSSVQMLFCKHSSLDCATP
jgi:hypothetical protein